MRTSATRWAPVVGLAGLLVALAGGLWSGMGWQDEDGFTAAAKAEGWIEIGRFGDQWPARIREERLGYESLNFQRGDGSRHAYAGFHGYRLRAVFLDALDGSETIVVLRAARKGRPGDEVLLVR